ncbi:hypothetical protein ACFPU0_11475 [Pseudomonas sp. GCM10022186]|uniref:hypothetical protein n=1 Tax=Pseudomonas sp. GCM10022186 TaxID=3252650 RepID=UPI0036239A5D
MTCAKGNPLVRSGLTQDGRIRAELATGHFLPDERDLADLILFGQRYARHVQFYDAGNAKAEDWSEFFEGDVTASLAGLAKLPVDAFRGAQLDLENWLKADPTRDPTQLAAHARLGFHLPLILLQIAGQHHARLPSDHPFGATLVELAARNLAAPLGGLIGWYKGAFDASLGAGNEVFADGPLLPADYNIAGGPGDTRLRLSATLAAAIAGQPAFSVAPVPAAILAKAAPAGWAALYAATAADPSPYVDAIGQGNQRYEQIYDALSYNLLSTAVEHIYQGLERIRRDASTHLEESLASFAGHAPNYGLWLAFLKLFEHARGVLNRFTERHLDFYFRDVLRLGNRAAQPDRVHLLFELAKGVDAHLLRAGTLLRGGKDALGRPVSYALDNDIVVNRASVAELRGLQLLAGGTSSAPTRLPLAALAVRSRDGLGEVALAKDEPSWAPFGPAASPAARIGFAVADRKLFLREGIRTISLRAELKSPLATTAISPRWVVRLTGDKGWFELRGTAQIATVLDNSFSETAEVAVTRPASKARSKAAASNARKKSGAFTDKPARGKALHILEITLTLDPEDPPIIPLDAKLHGSDYPPGVPLAEILFDFDAPGSARAFAVLRDIRASRLTLGAEAGGLKNLMVIAGGGVVDVAKPFAPFGAQPATGAQWIIGSAEIFSKPIDEWALRLDWASSYSSTGYFRSYSADSFNPTEAVLSEGRWNLVSTSSGRAARHFARKRKATSHTDIGLGESDVEVAMKGADEIDGLTPQTLENPPLGATSLNGFVRLTLPRDFGHAAFVRENTLALIGLSGGTPYTKGTGVNVTSQNLPREPYNPMVTRLEAAYITTRDPVEDFTLLHPFGLSDGTTDGRLFPALPFEGALLIGVKDFVTPARLSLLVQVADGSGDPLKQAPPLQFHYLAGDDWQALDEQDIDDKTGNFSSSAVLGLNLPEAADTTHRVLPSGLHWIRIAVTRDAAALNRLLSVDAQAARASFVDAGNDPAFLATPLPAGTIAKLATPELAIKKISQPYSSFDGRPAEGARAFATRVSERLRHKDRAVTLWDYEALVLEAFPRLYRVKCLGTTELQRNAQNAIIADNEAMPGAVTVVTVPWTHGQNARDPLRPYTDQATLAAVDAFLRKRISPFVRLEVQNPKFEEVQVEFKVKFLPGIGDIAFYIDELNKALVGFLTPWSRPGGGEITFGGRLWKSTIIDFVEELPQVDYVTDFRLYHKVDITAPTGAWSPVDVELIAASTARSILVSAARHSISEVPGHA